MYMSDSNIRIKQGIPYICIFVLCFVGKMTNFNKHKLTYVQLEHIKDNEEYHIC